MRGGLYLWFQVSPADAVAKRMCRFLLRRQHTVIGTFRALGWRLPRPYTACLVASWITGSQGCTPGCSSLLYGLLTVLCTEPRTGPDLRRQ